MESLGSSGASPSRRVWQLALAVCVSALFAVGCDALESIARGMERARAIQDLSDFRSSAWAVAIVGALTVLARILARWIGKYPVAVLAGIALPVTWAALICALERPPTVFPYASAYFGVIVVAVWLAVDAWITLGSASRGRRLLALGAALVALGGVVVAFAPRVGGPIVDAFAPGDAIGCVRHDRGGWFCWGMPKKPSARMVDVPDGPLVGMRRGICSLADGALACEDGSKLNVGGRVTAMRRAKYNHLAVVNERLIEVDESGETTSSPSGCTDRRVGPVVSLAVDGGARNAEESGCLLRPDGTVSCWREGRVEAETIDPDALDSLVEQRSFSGRIDCPVVVQLRGEKVRAIAAGKEHAAALTADGRLFTWGHNEAGQLGRPTSASSDNVPAVVPDQRFVEIAAADDATCARTGDRRVFCWGLVVDAHSTSPRRIDLPPADRLFFDGRCTCALSDGELWCSGLCSLPLRDLEHVRAIAGEAPASFAHARRIAL